MRRHLAYLVIGLIVAAISGGCSLKTAAPNDNQVFAGSLKGMTAAQLQTFAKGSASFSHRFTPDSGLGPVFNQPSCGACHVAAGRGHPFAAARLVGVVDPTHPLGFDPLIELGGPQLQERAIPGYQAETLPDVANLIVSTRIPPQVSGLGLIEFIPDETILAQQDPNDADGDGISGRANWITPPSYFEPVITNVVNDGKLLGRFGWKATGITLLHQTVSSYIAQMGITSEFHPTDLFNPLVGPFTGDAVADPEVATSDVRNVVFYLQTLRAPLRRKTEDEPVKRGEGLFAEVGCAKCHTPEMRTGKDAPIDVLRDQPVPLYSDLLLHEMGDALADNYPEGNATGREWRTPPLWGIGIVQNTQGGRAFYLHDGRTSDLTEAITLHGGEAEAVKQAFLALSEDDRAAIIAFLKSL